MGKTLEKFEIRPILGTKGWPEKEGGVCASRRKGGFRTAIGEKGGGQLLKESGWNLAVLKLGVQTGPKNL